MIFMLILLAFVLAIVFMARQRRRLAYGCAAFALLLSVGFGSGPFARWLIDPLQRPYVDSAIPTQWAPNSALVVLGMGNARVGENRYEPNPLAYGRIRMAELAYQACKKSGARCTVIFSGGAEARRGEAEARIYANEAIRLGMSPADVIVESSSHNTWENARYTRPILEKLAPNRVYLITSGLHLGRSLLYFRHHGISATPIRPDYLMPLDGMLPQAYNIGVADVALGEYKGLLQYRVYNALGLNARPSAPLKLPAP